MGSDLVDLARRIGAALNVDVKQPRLFWLTGLTNEGSILVANNYGIGFIPDGVKLPERVKFVSADESIPAVERGKWATYPIAALHGWAQAHDTTLRAVIATEEQLKGFDSGVAQVILQPDDLPANGQMQGRSRLEVIAPDSMARLSKVGDGGLAELLPPAPADPEAPEDRRAKLLREVFQPLLSKDPGRVLVHMNAMIAYVNHLQELALHRAHTAAGPDAQRVAIADAIYWQHLSVLNTEAITNEQA
ncbi:secretion protein EccK [Mycolicibacterium sp. XJ870]